MNPLDVLDFPDDVVAAMVGVLEDEIAEQRRAENRRKARANRRRSS